MLPTLVSRADEGIVTLAEVRKYLRADGVSDDTSILLAMAAAADYIATRTGRTLFESIYTESFNGFSGDLTLQSYPIRSITSITYYDTSEVLQTLANTEYALVNDTPAYIEEAFNKTFPDTSSRNRSVTVTYVAGHTALNVPPALRLAMLQLAGWFYEPLEQRPWGNMDHMLNLHRCWYAF